MNTFIERYKAFSNLLLNLVTSILQGSNSLANFIGRLILFIIVIFAMLVILGFTGILEDPSVLWNF